MKPSSGLSLRDSLPLPPSPAGKRNLSTSVGTQGRAPTSKGDVRAHSDCRGLSGISLSLVSSLGFHLFALLCFGPLKYSYLGKDQAGIGKGTSSQVGRGRSTLQPSPSTSRMPCFFIFCPSFAFLFLCLLPSQGCGVLCPPSSSLSPFLPLPPLAVSVSLLSWAVCMCLPVFPLSIEARLGASCVSPCSLPLSSWLLSRVAFL